ncbi:MAG: flippase-like domain-containing protein [Acidimicrobiales bacterium]|nr:flippase-like domain-containing protein [Acidimicrobiales bacterium]
MPSIRANRNHGSDAAAASPTVEIIEPSQPAFVRTAGDAVRAVEATVAFVAAVLIAAVFRGGLSGAERDVVHLADAVPEVLATILIALGQVVGIVGPVAVVIALVVIGRLRTMFMVALAAGAGAIAMFGVSSALSSEVALPGQLGELRAVAYPGARFLAGASAVLTVLASFLDRPWRRFGVGLIALAAFTRIASGADSPYDVAIAIVLGYLLGALILLVFGSPNRRPTGTAVVRALCSAGLDPARLEFLASGVRGSTTYCCVERNGNRHFVKVFPPDRAEADRLVQLYRRLRLRDAVNEQPFSTLRRSVEHEALVALYAADRGVPTADLTALAEVNPGGMVLAFEHLGGEHLQGKGKAIDDDTLCRLWEVVVQLQRAGIAHRDLRLAHVIRDDDGRPKLVDFGYGEIAATDLQLRTDVAELLCSSAIEVGAPRAVHAAVSVLGRDTLGASLSVLQPLALRTETRKALGEREGLLDELRSEVQHATGIDEVSYEELARFKPRTIVGMAVFALALYALLPRFAEVSDIGRTLADAKWQWLVPLLFSQGVTYIGAGIAMAGSVPDRVPMLPMMRAQVAAAFVDVLAPASVGGMTLNTRFLQRRGVDSGVAVAGVGLNALGGLVAHLLLLGVFLLWVGSATSVETELTSEPAPSSSPVGTIVLVAVAVMAVAGLLLALPFTRRMVVRRVAPLLAQAKTGLVELAKRPRKIAMLIGGSTVVTLGFLGALVCSIEAFGGGVSIAHIGVAYLIASSVAIVAPTPGGLGAVEAALIAALTGLGMSSDKAVSSVFLFRGVTFWLPVVPGWLTFHLMQRNGEI